MWCWEKSDSFDLRLQELQGKEIELPMPWVDCFGNPVEVSGEVTACDRVRLQRIQRGELIGDISELLFRDPNCFRAGELHNHFEYWQYIARDSSSPQQAQILGWIRDKVSIRPFFKHFKGSFKGELFDSDEPPMKVFKNNVSCKPFVSFVEETLVARLKSGAISLLGRVGVVDPPFIVLPLTVEPTKPRLCHDARYLNLWMRDMPFSLDRLIDLPRYVGKDTYQTVLDDKSGYDHILLSEDSRTYFGIQWGGWYFTYKPSLENFVVLTWLKLIHPDLPRLVKQRYGTELRSRTLASIKAEVSQALNSLLDEIRASDDAKVMRTATGGFRRSTPIKSLPRKGPRPPRQSKPLLLPLQRSRLQFLYRRISMSQSQKTLTFP